MALKQVTYAHHTFDIAYDLVNPTASKTIVFLHGWGSNKEIMKQGFAKTLPEFKHIYVDMPGFGKSSNEMVLTTKEYATIMQLFLEELGYDSCSELTIAGHSFGGKVATLLQPKNLILLSTAGIIEPKPFKVRAKIKLAKFLNLFGLGKITKAFRSSDVNQMSQNMYETFKNVVDEDFSATFQAYSGKTFIFWGENDRATSLESGEKIHSLIKNSEMVSYNGDHYFFLKYNNDIAKRLENGIL